MTRAHRVPSLVILLALAACATAPSPRPSAPPLPGVVPVYNGPSPGNATGSAAAGNDVAPVDGPAPSWQKDFPPAPEEIPAGIENTPDAVPVPEARSSSGNSKSYEVLGRSYNVIEDARGFKQRGYASWYGKKFHGRKTASGERYNMFKMTAAHKTLPLPTYVRVTNLANGKSTVVKVNDRGPFHSDRIIDLSYAAAAKLDLIGHGTSMVQIETVEPEAGATAVALAQAQAPPPPEPAPAETPITASVSAVPSAKASDSSGFLQVAAYIDPINAVAMREDLRKQGIAPVEIHVSTATTPPLHRVLVGPFRDADAARDARKLLARRKLSAQWVRE